VSDGQTKNIFSDSYSVTNIHLLSSSFAEKKDWPDRPTTWPERPSPWPERPEKKIIKFKKPPFRPKFGLAGTSGQKKSWPERPVFT